MYLQFGTLFLVVSTLTSAASPNPSAIDTGCSVDFDRIVEDINGRKIDCGRLYPWHQVSGSLVPKIQYTMALKDKKYTVAMIDPDAPSGCAPMMRSFLHYLAVNVKGSVLRKLVSLTSPKMSPRVSYMPPGPPRYSGLHRYIIYVMQQRNGKRIAPKLGKRSSENFDIEGTKKQMKALIKTGKPVVKRIRFDIDKFAKKYKLSIVGSNMFITMWENQN